MLARGQDRRNAELAGIYTFTFEDESTTSACFPLILMSVHGKTNQHNRVEAMAAFRHRDPFVRPLGAAGFYLLYRWVSMSSVSRS